MTPKLLLALALALCGMAVGQDKPLGHLNCHWADSSYKAAFCDGLSVPTPKPEPMPQDKPTIVDQMYKQCDSQGWHGKITANKITVDCDEANGNESAKPEPMPPQLPMNVKAIVKPVSRELLLFCSVPCAAEAQRCQEICDKAMKGTVITCPPGHWQLNHTEDGAIHWCSRPPVLEGKP